MKISRPEQPAPLVAVLDARPVLAELQRLAQVLRDHEAHLEPLLAMVEQAMVAPPTAQHVSLLALRPGATDAILEGLRVVRRCDAWEIEQPDGSQPMTLGISTLAPAHRRHAPLPGLRLQPVASVEIVVLDGELVWRWTARAVPQVVRQGGQDLTSYQHGVADSRAAAQAAADRALAENGWTLCG